MLSVLEVLGTVAPVVQNARAAGPVDFTIGYLESVDSLNPFRGTTDPAYELYGYIYDYLFSFDQDGNLVPNLAVNAHCDAVCMNWTYQIRQGVTWSDGTAFTAQDVMFTINYNTANFNVLWANEPYVNRIISCPGTPKPGCGAYIFPGDPWNVTVYFDRPFVPGKALFIPIIQQAQWSKIKPSAAQSTYNNTNPIGTGPFIADPNIYNEWVSGAPLHLTKNANYHPVGTHVGPVHIDNLYLEQFNEENTLVSALENGAVDLAKFTSNGYAAVAGAPGVSRQQGLLSTQYWNEIGITQIPGTKTSKGLPCCNATLNPARYDTSVRQALAMATNKNFIVNTYYQGAGIVGTDLMSNITPQWYYDPVKDGTNFTFNIAAANALLDSAGYTDWSGGSPGNGYRLLHAAKTITSANGWTTTIPAGTPLTFTMAVRQEFTQEQNTAQYLKTQWAQIGVQITLKVELESSLIPDVYGGQVEMYIWFWSGDPDPNYLLSIESGFTLDGWNDNYYDNGTYNNLYVEQLAAFDNTTRQSLVRQAERVHYLSATYIIYIYPYGEWAYRSDRWTGWGDWVAHPYRQLDAFWGANPLFFDLQPTGVSTNHCPTKPVISGSPPISVIANKTTAFVGSSTDTDPGQTLNWTWYWGDKNKTVDVHPTSVTQDTASWAWATPGSYSVTLSVFDGQCTETSDPFGVNVLPETAVGWINGTVTDSATKLPISGASLKTWPTGFAGATDTSGKYSIVAVPGTYMVNASALNYLNSSVSGIVVVQGQTVIQNFTLELHAGWIAGTVSSSTGGALSGASIYVYGAGGAEFATTTNASGGYKIELAPGTYAVNASMAGYNSQNATGIVVSLGQTTVKDFSLTPVAGPETGLSGLIVAVIVAVVVIAAAAILWVFLLRRKRQKREKEEELQLTKK